MYIMQFAISLNNVTRLYQKMVYFERKQIHSSTFQDVTAKGVPTSYFKKNIYTFQKVVLLQPAALNIMVSYYYFRH